MVRLLIASDCFLPRWDGIARFLADIVPRLPFEVTVIAPDFPGKTPDSNATVVRVPLSRFKVGDFPLAQSSATLMKTHVAAADMVWTHTVGAVGAAAIMAGASSGKPVASYVHSLDWELVPKSLSSYNPFRGLARSLAQMRVRRCYNKSHLLMVPSREVEELMAYKGVRTSTRIVHLGTRIDKFKPVDKAVAKEKLGIAAARKVIGYVGRLSREKDVETLIAAFKRVRLHHDALLLVVGDGLLDIKAKLLSPGIMYVGQSDDVVPYLQAMDIYVLPSLTETTSLSTLEAMACGAVPVCTPVGLVKSYVKEKENGLFFPARNAFVLSLKLTWLLENPALIQRMSAHARTTVIQHFDWEDTVRSCIVSLGFLYEQATGRKPERQI